MKKAVIIISILALITWGVFSIIKSEKEKNERETARFEYETKVSQLNAENAYYFKQNKDLISEVKDLKKANQAHRDKRAEIKTVWRDNIVIAKAACDTNLINSLDKTHKESEAQCDSSIANLETQVKKLEEVISNDSTIISGKDSIITLSNELIQKQDKQIKKEKTKVFFAKIGAGAALVFAIVLAF